MTGIKFSVIVPVFHEGNRINNLIEHLYHLDFDKELEIIVVDGCEERDTLRAIKSQNVIKRSSEKGRAKQMNAGARVAGGEVLIFLHADTELLARAPKRINDLNG